VPQREMWLWSEVAKQVAQKGGWINCHHHLCSDDTLNRNWYDTIGGEMSLSGKWGVSDELKKGIIYKTTRRPRMNGALLDMADQGVVACRAYVNVDTIVGLEEITIACSLKHEWANKGFYLQIAAYASRDIREPDEQRVLREALENFPEIECIGGVPSRGRKDEYDLDTTHKSMGILAQFALEYDKHFDVQIDQDNDPDEKEAEKLVYWAEWLRDKGFEKGINGTHLISLSAWPRERWSHREWIIGEMARLGVTAVTCPGAALGMRQKEEKEAPIHSSIAPVRLLLEEGVKVGLGTDNVSDLYEPSGRGSMVEELSLLWKAIRWQGPIDTMTDIASTFGREVLRI